MAMTALALHHHGRNGTYLTDAAPLRAEQDPTAVVGTTGELTGREGGLNWSGLSSGRKAAFPALGNRPRCPSQSV